MPSMKIYPLAQLPDRDVTETQFNIWQEELEAYLVQEKDFAVFLKDGSYDEWESYETNNNRIPTLKAEDTLAADEAAGKTAIQARTANEAFLKNIRKNLRTALSIVGKCVSQGHYNSVVQHSTSLEWIYKMSGVTTTSNRRAFIFLTSLRSNILPTQLLWPFTTNTGQLS